jgi:hypothetical protein
MIDAVFYLLARIDLSGPPQFAGAIITDTPSPEDPRRGVWALVAMGDGEAETLESAQAEALAMLRSTVRRRWPELIPHIERWSWTVDDILNAEED